MPPSSTAIHKESLFSPQLPASTLNIAAFLIGSVPLPQGLPICESGLMLRAPTLSPGKKGGDAGFLC